MRAHVYMLLYSSTVRAQVYLQRAQVYDAHNSNLHAQSSMQVDILFYSRTLLLYKGPRTVLKKECPEKRFKETIVFHRKDSRFNSRIIPKSVFGIGQVPI